MCICDIEFSRRHWLKLAVLGAESALIASGSGCAATAPEPGSAADALLREAISVDLHSHAGGLAFAPKASDEVARQIHAGRLTAICLAHVPDGPVIGRRPDGVLGILRKPKPGELYQGHLERLDWADTLVAEHGLRRALDVADLRAAKAANQPAMVQDVEGCDFLDGHLERLAEAHRRGIRVVQLVHYIPNDIGDFQTGPVTHHGLTDAGARVVRELNRLQMVVDVAHGTEDLVRDVAAVTTRPLLLSHTAIQGSRAQGRSPLQARQISPAHARLVASSGGVIGLWHFFPSLQAYVDGIHEMVDVVGADHVGIGTDQQVSPGALQHYDQFPAFVELMLRSGFSDDDTRRIIGGNFVRLWTDVLRTASA